MSNKVRFIDLFAGIGGFHIAFHRLNAECVFASEIDKHARTTYEHNLKHISPELFKNGLFNDDILKITDANSQIPDFDILCAGFPCQPFSQAGFKRGFGENLDARGNMFFRICDIIKEKRPKAFFLENVRHLIKHDNERTFATIKKILEKDLNYTFHYKVVKASEHGLPQHRPRVFIVGFDKDYYPDPSGFEFPEAVPLEMTMSDIWGGKCSKDIGYTLRVGGRGSGLHDRRNWDSYLVDGKERRLSPKEGKKMMGFPDNFEFPVSEVQALKQLGNSVAVNAVQATAQSILEHMKILDEEINKTGKIQAYA
ncbi:MAG: DNA (cytosine-5-)-methyltransferase [Micavibrio sp.]|nr:DNA (cytosine-5-)-methyltransferase [Micavibrio sp.]